MSGLQISTAMTDLFLKSTGRQQGQVCHFCQPSCCWRPLNCRCKHGLVGLHMEPPSSGNTDRPPILYTCPWSCHLLLILASDATLGMCTEWKAGETHGLWVDSSRSASTDTRFVSLQSPTTFMDWWQSPQTCTRCFTSSHPSAWESA